MPWGIVALGYDRTKFRAFQADCIINHLLWCRASHSHQTDIRASSDLPVMPKDVMSGEVMSWEHLGLEATSTFGAIKISFDWSLNEWKLLPIVL